MELFAELIQGKDFSLMGVVPSYGQRSWANHKGVGEKPAELTFVSASCGRM